MVRFSRHRDRLPRAARQAARLRANESRLDTILRSASDAVIATDAAHRVVLFNAAAERLFQCSEADALGAPVSRFLPDTRALADTAPHQVAGLRADGAPLSLEAACSSGGQEGDPLYTLVLRDISARLAHEQENERIKRLYAALSQINQAIVWTHDRDELFRKVCDALIGNEVFRMCWIGWHDADTRRLLPVAQAGDHQGYTRDIVIYTDDR
nr:PAS domain-containing protein [Opitutaceae bacterium]